MRCFIDHFSFMFIIYHLENKIVQECLNYMYIPDKIFANLLLNMYFYFCADSDRTRWENKVADCNRCWQWIDNCTIVRLEY